MKFAPREQPNKASFLGGWIGYSPGIGGMKGGKKGQPSPSPEALFIVVGVVVATSFLPPPKGRSDKIEIRRRRRRERTAAGQHRPTAAPQKMEKRGGPQSNGTRE